MSRLIRPGRRDLLLGALWALPALGLAGPGLAQAIPTRTVHSATELEEAFASAPDGSRLLLAPGRYDQARLKNRSFPRGLVLTSADPANRAVFVHNLYLDGIDNVTVSGVDFVTGGFFEHRGRMDKVQLGLTSCRNIVVQDADFTGYIPQPGEGVDAEAPNLERHDPLEGYARDVGVAIESGANILLEGLRLYDHRTALNAGNSERIRMQGIEITRAREGINFLDTRDLTISECHFHGLRPWLAEASPKRDHPDMIQYWAGPEEIGVHRIEIRDSLFHQGAGDIWTQTIFGHLRNLPNQADKASEIYVTGNTIVNRHVWGIFLGEASQAVIADNLLLPAPDLPDAPEQINTPTISLEGCHDVDVIRNTLLPYAGLDRPIRSDKGAIQDGRVRLAQDNRFLATRPVLPEFWRKVEPDLSSPAAAYRRARGWAA